MNLISADILFNASEEFDIDTDDAAVSNDASLSQADAAAISNEVSSEGLCSPEDGEIPGRSSNEDDNTSALAALAINSRKASKSMFHVRIEVNNSAPMQRRSFRD